LNAALADRTIVLTDRRRAAMKRTSMIDAPRLVVATGNPGKLREIRSLLAPTGWEALSLAEAGVDHAEVIETGRSYLENAVAKAVAVARISGLPALADDSGLEVDALDGRPGVTSARYGGPLLTDAERTARLLRELEGVPSSRRHARFRSVVALALPGGERHVREGVLEGNITTAPRGQNGFGYDPVFQIADGRTLAEIGDEKQQISHRSLALRAMMDVLGVLHGRAGRSH
jgi:XTP/dITP diphosphohydrolase